MKIAMFTDTYVPQLNGVATSILMLSQNLRALGHEVHVFTTTDPHAPPGEQDVHRLPSLPFLKSYRMGMFYHPGVARMMKRMDMDVIHTHTEFCLGMFGRVLARELGLPTIHTMHTVYEDYTHYLFKLRQLESVSKQIARKLSADFCNAADRVVAPTEKVVDLLRSYGVHKPIDAIPSGIELGRFSPGRYSQAEIAAIKTGLGIGMDEKVLLFVGRVAEEKNIAELLRYLCPYIINRPGLKFLLVGDGPDRPRLEAMAKELGMADKTVFAGARPWEEIGAYYQVGDVFVNTSQSEAQGLTYIEAMAAGVPVVAKADRCLEGVLLEDENGYAFSDMAGMHRALDKVLSDRQEWQRLRENALMTAKDFSAAEYAQRIADAYARVL